MNDCFNFSCPAYTAQCPCVACPNRTLSDITITSNRILTEQEISEILAKMQNKEEEEWR